MSRYETLFLRVDSFLLLKNIHLITHTIGIVHPAQFASFLAIKV